MARGIGQPPTGCRALAPRGPRWHERVRRTRAKALRWGASRWGALRCSDPRISGISLAAAVAACAPFGAEPVQTAPAPDVVAPEVYELANIRPDNVVPKSSPSALVNTFEDFCLDGSHDPAQVAARLRRAGFVAVPKALPGAPQAAQPTTITADVVDDRRPMVMISEDGRTCAVIALSRTGQTARIQEMIAQRFPSAQALDPAAISQGTELAVRVTGAGAGVLFVQRLAPTIPHSRLILGIVRER